MIPFTSPFHEELPMLQDNASAIFRYLSYMKILKKAISSTLVNASEEAHNYCCLRGHVYAKDHSR